jgi:hypothetical protein
VWSMNYKVVLLGFVRAVLELKQLLSVIVLDD